MDLVAEAEAYAAADFSQVNQAFVDRLLELAGARATARALDLGTGPADIPIRVLRARPGWRVVAVDASGPMLDIARRAVERSGLAAAIELVNVDAKSMPFPSHSFDVIFSNSILHHVTDADDLWAEVRRLGHAGTVVLMRDLARPADADAARRIVEQYASNESQTLQEEYYRSLLASYRPDEVRSQLDRAGLTTLEVAMVSDRHLDVYGSMG
jgi:ubiquinone/menaquinone biosynthesis C-methylase UbiE